LRVRFDIEPTSPEGHDVVTYSRDLDVTPCTERLRPGELVAQLLQATATHTHGALVLVFLTTRATTRGARARRGHWHLGVPRRITAVPMPEVTGSLTVLKLIVDGLVRDTRIAPDAQVTISQAVIDATAETLRRADAINSGRIHDTSIGFKDA
jgi:hypothetical protein